MDVIIFAAGHGTRLQPLTDTLPKPLIEINGLSLIEIHLYRLASVGFRRVIINLHHLGGLIRSRLGDGSRYGLQIIYSEEAEDALETAGGIVHALHLIQGETFATISADVPCDYPLDQLVSLASSEAQGHLVMVENPAHHPVGDFALDESSHLISQQAPIARPTYTFSGLAWFRRALFEHLPPGKRALRPVLETAVGQKQLLGKIHTGLWSDIGTLERLDQARASAEVSGYIKSIKQLIS